jgi:hypothetical protein
MLTLRSLVPNTEPGIQVVGWENRGRPEYSTPYDAPSPDVPIHAEVTVTKYAMSISRGPGSTLDITNKLADVEGKVELYEASVNSHSLIGAGTHSDGELEVELPPALVEWRVRIRSSSTSLIPSDVYLLNCTGKDGCYVAAQAEITGTGQTVVADSPTSGKWKILVRSRVQQMRPRRYSVQEAQLRPSVLPIETLNLMHSSGSTWSITLPVGQEGIQYAAFRIAGTPGEKRQEKGMQIAMTPIGQNLP